MSERRELYRNTRNRARDEARAQNIRQDNISRNVSSLSGPNNPFNNPARDNYQTYPYDYYSGADAKIFFGDIWVDDIVTLQYNVNQTKTPIWGYASQHFDAVAKGQVIVQGTLSIAFKETGYLNIIQTLLERQRSASGSKAEAALQKYKLKAEQGVAKFIPGLDRQQTANGENGVVYSANGTPSFIRQSQTIEEILKSKIISSDLGNSFGVGEKQRDFEDFAELLEDSIWGDANGRHYDTKPRLKRADEFDYDNKGGIRTGRSPYSDVLNIVLTFGDINDFRAEHTIISLNDVHFQSQSMVISPDGNPIAETYTFFARDINDAIGKSSVYRINPIKLETGLDNVEISKLDDINAIEGQLLREERPQYIIIKSSAALPRDGRWKALGAGDPGYFSIAMDNYNVSQDTLDGLKQDENDKEEAYQSRSTRRRERLAREAVSIRSQTEKTAFGMSFNSSEPLIDQIINYVEREINEFDGNTVDVRNQQYIIEVEFRSQFNGQPENKFTMVIEQSIPASRTYKVISPTRQNFGAANIITREDLFSSISAARQADEDIDISINRNRQIYQQALLNREEYEATLQQLTGDKLGQVREEMSDRQEKIDRLAGIDDPNLIQRRRLERLQQQQTEALAAANELSNETFSSSDRDLISRRDRDKFEAALDDYTRFSEEADYYGNLSADLASAEDNIIGNGAVGLTPDSNLSDEALAAKNRRDIISGQLTLGATNVNESPTADELTTIRENQNKEISRLMREGQDFLATATKDFTIVDAENATHEQWMKQLDIAGIQVKNFATEGGDEIRFDNIRPEIGSALGKAKEVFDQFNQRLVITSANDSKKHDVNSLHHEGAAVDIRTKDLLGGYTGYQAYELVSSLQQELGDDYDVVLEGDHIHLEYDPNNKPTLADQRPPVNIESAQLIAAEEVRRLSEQQGSSYPNYRNFGNESIIFTPDSEYPRLEEPPEVIAAKNEIAQLSDNLANAWDEETGRIVNRIAERRVNRLFADINEEGVNEETFNAFIDSSKQQVEQRLVRGKLEDVASNIGLSEDFVGRLPQTLENIRTLGNEFLGGEGTIQIRTSPSTQVPSDTTQNNIILSEQNFSLLNTQADDANRTNYQIALNQQAAEALNALKSDPEAIKFIEDNLPSWAYLLEIEVTAIE